MRHLLAYPDDQFVYRIRVDGESKLRFASQRDLVASGINPQRIPGPWDEGWSLDVHTIRSVPDDRGGFDTVRSNLGELVFQLKYRKNTDVIRKIAKMALVFLLRFKDLRALVPVPGSDPMSSFRPSFLVARELSQGLGVPVATPYLIKTLATPPLKGIADPRAREKALRGSMRVADFRFEGQSVLLLDDLYRSGTTMRYATKLLREQGGVGTVYAVALTRTRTNR